MKFSINQSQLIEALSAVVKGISARSTMPILSGILIEAKDDELSLQSTDLELSIKYTVMALVEETGAAVFPGKLFADIVKNLEEGAIHVSADETTASIMSSNSDFTIKVLDAQDFPSFPAVETVQQIEIPFMTFSNMVRKVVRMVSRDESRAILTGVLLQLEGGHLRMVATDSYRLAVCEQDIEGDVEDFEAVISGSFLNDVISLPKSENNVCIALAENQIVISYQNTVFVNRRIEGNYPNYKQLLPNSSALSITLPTDELAAAVKRSGLLGSASTTVRFSIDTDAQVLRLSSSAQDIGSLNETVQFEGSGESMEIAFNCIYVSDGLSVIQSDTVEFEALSSFKPGIFKSVGEKENFLYLVMPVRIV